MTTRIPRHDFRTDNATEAMRPVLAAAQEVIAGIETSEGDRFDALRYAPMTAKWQCRSARARRWRLVQADRAHG